MDETTTAETTETVENSTPIEDAQIEAPSAEPIPTSPNAGQGVRIKVLMRTRYTYQVCSAGSIAPLFEMSVIEKDPDLAGAKTLSALQANVGDISQYELHLKLLEILD